jgi:predicted TIM-barrel fold metal-dependent hydrolase
VLIIDTHPHVMTAPSVRYPHQPVGGRQSGWSRGIELDGAAFAAMMRAAGVARAVLVQTSTVYGPDNRFLADTVAGRPQIFAGVCSVDALAADAPGTLSYWVRERRLSGVRLFSAAAAAGVLFEVDDPRLDLFWRRAQELAVPVDLQVRYPAMAAVRRVLERYPSVRVILDHLGGAPVTGGPPYRAAADLFSGRGGRLDGRRLPRAPGLSLRRRPRAVGIQLPQHVRPAAAHDRHLRGHGVTRARYRLRPR